MGLIGGLNFVIDGKEQFGKIRQLAVKTQKYFLDGLLDQHRGITPRKHAIIARTGPVGRAINDRIKPVGKENKSVFVILRRCVGFAARKRLDPRHRHRMKAS